MTESLGNGAVTLRAGDCLAVLPTLEENSIDSCVTDPPYHLTSIVKRFGAENAAPAKAGKTGAYKRASAGFMGRKWDAPDAPAIEPGFAHWFAGFVDGEGCFSVHKKTVNGCETYDCQFSMTLRADDKPIILEIQRQLGGIGSVADRPAPKEGSGKPQIRYCISSQRDCQRLREILFAFPLRAKKARDFEIWSHALDAWLAHEPKQPWDDVAYFRDALMAVRQYGSDFNPSQLFHYRWARQVYRVLKPGGHLLAFCGTRTYGRMATAIEDAGFEVRDSILYLYGSGFPKSHNLDGEWRGWGTALKPGAEFICMARKPLTGTVAANVLKWGTGALNIDGCRVATDPSVDDPRLGGRGSWTTTQEQLGHTVTLPRGEVASSPLGRWPANVIHDGSAEVVEAFPDAPGQAGAVNGREPSTDDRYILSGLSGNHAPREPRGDSGSAARFFYSAKADADDRLGSKHPTVKPLDLMQYLVRLVTPPKGLCLDPFAGTGTTGEACIREGMRAILIEREEEYQNDIRRRMKLAMSGPDERAREAIKAKLKDTPPDHGPLFGVVA